jgi:glucose-6-phosphate 1-epimerase
MGAGSAVRGGVPVIFPQFSTRGPLPRHGFARTRAWTMLEHQRRGAHDYAVLGLADDASTRALWPHPFNLELTVSVDGQRLDMELAVINTGDTTFGFHAALHTYLRCHDVRKAQLEGLLDQNYVDQINGEERGQWIDVVTIAQEIDRIYWNTPPQLTLRESGRRLGIAQQGFTDTVVWNPGPEKCALMPDMPADDWLQMLCVEAAQVGEPVHIGPGEEWSGMQTLIAG